MKRFLVLMTAAVLFLSVACAAAAETFSTSYFSLDLPDGWEIDTTDLEEEENAKTLGLFFGKTSDGFLVGNAFLVNNEGWKDVSLWNSSEEELKEYADSLLEDFADTNPELIGTVLAMDGKIPLVMIRGTDKDGEFVYADTMTNGVSIEFEFYVSDDEGDKQLPLTDEHIEQIKTILTSLKPA